LVQQLADGILNAVDQILLEPSWFLVVCIDKLRVDFLLVLILASRLHQLVALVQLLLFHQQIVKMLEIVTQSDLSCEGVEEVVCEGFVHLLNPDLV
jgi:hypothetical protein